MPVFDVRLPGCSPRIALSWAAVRACFTDRESARHGGTIPLHAARRVLGPQRCGIAAVGPADRGLTRDATCTTGSARMWPKPWRGRASRPSPVAVDFFGLIFHGTTVTHIDSLAHFFWEGRKPKSEMNLVTALAVNYQKRVKPSFLVLATLKPI